jgi:ABC-type uncharacterized transport system substrate-binding protein
VCRRTDAWQHEDEGPRDLHYGETADRVRTRRPSDPVQLGLVTNLSQPSGNVTGAAQLNVQVGPKRLELLHELVPTAKVVALLLNPSSPAAEPLSREVQAAAGVLGLRLHVMYAGAERDFVRTCAAAPLGSRPCRSNS